MRHVKVPAPVQVQGLWIGLPELVRDLLDRDERFTQTAAGLRAAVRIEAALCAEEATGVLEEADHRLLAAAAEHPSAGYLTLAMRSPTGELVGRPIQIGRALLPFVEAILSAEQALKVVREA